MLAGLSKHWWALLIRGIVAIAAGILAMAWPGVALGSLVIIFIVFALVDGVASVVIGIRGEEDGSYWWMMIALGLLAIAAAIGAIFYPMTALAVFLGFVAVTAILRGIFEIAAAIRLRAALDNEWVLIISGVASIVFGVLLLAWPGAGLVTLAILMGLYMLVVGVMAVVLSLRLRKVHQRISGEGAPAVA